MREFEDFDLAERVIVLRDNSENLIFQEFRELLQQRKPVDENPYLQIFQVLVQAQVRKVELSNQELCGPTFLYFVYSLSDASYTKVFICNSSYWYSYNVIRMFLLENDARLYHWKSQSVQVYEMDQSRRGTQILVGVDVVIRDRKQNKIFKVLTSLTQLSFSGCFHRISFDREELEKLVDRSVKYRRQEVDHSKLALALGQKFYFKFLTHQSSIQLE